MDWPQGMYEDDEQARLKITELRGWWCLVGDAVEPLPHAVPSSVDFDGAHHNE